ncbi:uncharacterized protein LOC134668692 [Cydia fagiglandana]|uniref:uncharacterized protein LOC134668692 n=1 Tax=Cydia fagiglandana TaxID=1458189 RepID=UPI002FEE5942
MDYLTKHCQKPLPWNLLYADDVVLISDNVDHLQQDLNTWVEALKANGLKISRKKTEHMSCIFDGLTDPKTINISIGDTPIPRVSEFKYLGSIVSNDGKIDRDVTHRTTTGWMKWRQLTGVMCDKKMPLKTKE